MKKTNWMTWLIILAFLMPLGIIFILNIISPNIFIVNQIVNNVPINMFDYEKAFSIYVEWFAAFCTILLGIVAASQNIRLQNLEEKTINKDSSCNIYLENSAARKSENITNEYAIGYKTEEEFISLSIKNYSDAFLKAIKVSFGEDDFYSSITLAKDCEKNIRILLPEKLDFEKICKVEYISCYDVSTYGDFKIQNISFDGYHYVLDYHFYGTEQPK